VLTQGSVLKVTANGTTSSPVVRGVWVTERILGRTTAEDVKHPETGEVLVKRGKETNS